MSTDKLEAIKVYLVKAQEFQLAQDCRELQERIAELENRLAQCDACQSEPMEG
jgi:hypothetical protein